MSPWRLARDIALLPGTVTIVIPLMILFSDGDANPGCSLPVPFHILPLLVGASFVGAGVSLLIRTIALFAEYGKGTLAPWDPTRRLVVRGVYRRVRNPMISGVFGILLGEAIFFGSLRLLYWFLVFVIINVTYIPLIEEHSMKRRFGEEYDLYKKNVPRWFPRLRPWNPPGDDPAKERG